MIDKPPYTHCFLCLTSRQKKCVRVPKPSGGSLSNPVPVRRSSRLVSTPIRHQTPPPNPSFLSQPVENPYLDAIPTAVPLYGTERATLPVLIAWHSEIFTSRAESRKARAAQTAAESSLKAAEAALESAEAAVRTAKFYLKTASSHIAVCDERVIAACKNYIYLVDGVVEVGLRPSPEFPGDSGKGKAAASSSSSQPDRKGKGKVLVPASNAGDDEEVQAESEDGRDDEGKGMDWSNN